MTTQLTKKLEARIDLAPPIIVGKVPEGYRRVIPITGGYFEGSNLKAKVLPIGADWNVVRPNGMGFLSARYMIETEDGVIISILNEGWFKAGKGLIEDLIDGEAPENSKWYAKLHPRFEAPEGAYEWLNHTVFVCELHLPKGPDKIDLTFYKLT